MGPAGRSLAFAGQHNGRYGLWLIDAATGAVRRLALGRSWPPPSHRTAGGSR
jgi:Tol biopolymer transport system component